MFASILLTSTRKQWLKTGTTLSFALFLYSYVVDTKSKDRSKAMRKEDKKATKPGIVRGRRLHVMHQTEHDELRDVCCVMVDVVKS